MSTASTLLFYRIVYSYTLLFYNSIPIFSTLHTLHLSSLLVPSVLYSALYSILHYILNSIHTILFILFYTFYSCYYSVLHLLLYSSLYSFSVFYILYYSITLLFHSFPTWGHDFSKCVEKITCLNQRKNNYFIFQLTLMKRF